VRSVTTALASRAALALLAMLWSVVGRARGQEPADREAPRVARLFEANEPLDLFLTANFDAIAKERGTTKHDHPAVLSYVGPAGDTVALDVELHTRGHFRLRTCRYPPLKVDFPRDRTANTVFAGQKGLKLVVQCWGNGSYADYLLEEYLLYRVYNLLTDLSFRVRLARVTYADSGKSDKPESRYAFFLEDDDAMAHRNGGKVFDQPGVMDVQTDRTQMGLVAVFEYLIGNTDWSVWGLHNIVLVQDSARNVLPVPYDFDWSGVISTPYARPDSRLGIATVRQRLFRTPCRTAEDLAPILARFTAERDSIYELYRGQAWLEPKRVKQALDYYDDFYRTIDDPRAVRRTMVLTCRGG
jgi:hypothetical protein